MMNIIPVIPATLDIIEKLNEGIRPELPEEEIFYVYNGVGKPAKFISAKELKTSSEYPEYMAIVKILYIGS
jgi:hypothetical protein